jgi:hypothetical protein
MVSMTGYWNAYKLDIPTQSPMAMPTSQDEAHTKIVDFTKITVSNSDNDLHLVRLMSARLDSWMPDIPEVEI